MKEHRLYGTLKVKLLCGGGGGNDQQGVKVQVKIGVNS